MLFQPDELLVLAARAAPFRERLERSVRCELSDDLLVAQRMRQWQLAVTGNENTAAAMHRFLAAQGLSTDNSPQWLGHVQWQGALPGWMETFVAFGDQLSNADSNSWFDDPVYQSKKPLPFQSLLIAFVHQFRTLIEQVDLQLRGQLAPSAWRSIERRLLAELCDLSSLVLGREFSRFRNRHNPIALFKSAANYAIGDDQLRQFVGEFSTGTAAQTFCEFPVLARMLAMRVRQWHKAAIEFCERLRTDLAEIQHGFGWTEEPGLIVELQPGLSDRHHDGRTVYSIRFESGRRLVYKPRGLDTESAFFDFIGWLNDRYDGLSLQQLKTFDRHEYGWIEHVQHHTCRSADEVRRYYQRAGMLLCLTYVLEGVDCHCENVIACGEYPVLIDAETLLHPRGGELEALAATDEADLAAEQQLQHSVLWTGMLPAWEPGAGGKSFDISSLGATADQSTGFRVPTWVDVNTDAMRLGSREGVTRVRQNQPQLDGRALSGWDYVDDIVDGFRPFYRWLLAHRDEILAPGGPLDMFRDRRVRVLVRPTSSYSVALERLRHPEFLRDGAEWSIELARLARPLLSISQPSAFARAVDVYHAECQALERGDIPYFYTMTDDTSLRCADRIVAEQFFPVSGLKRATQRFEAMCDEDLVTQSGFIQAALKARRPSNRGVAVNKPLEDALPQDAEDLPAQELLSESRRIAEEIESHSFRAADGSACWISFSYDALNERLRLEPTGHDFYSGRAGITFFLAAYEAVTGDDSFRQLTLDALQPLRTALRTNPAQIDPRRPLEIGAATGAGGLIYALVRIGQFLKCPQMIDDARLMLTHVDEQKIRDDRVLDVMSGSAGLILGLLAFYDETKDPSALAKAVACGRQLLDASTATESGRAWNSGHGHRPLTGISHGAAGIAYALLRLYDLTEDDALRDAASEAIDYEAQTFVDSERNWPDFRHGQSSVNSSPQCRSTWCHGAPGIGLARIGGLSMLDSEQVRADVKNALQTTLEHTLTAPDHLCCGNFGRLELLLLAGDQLKLTEYREQAARRAAYLVQRNQHTGAYVLHEAAGDGVYTPSLFIGTAGVGYQLLRLASPTLPSVLLWE